VVTSKKKWAERIGCVVDPCSFYWRGRTQDFPGFVFNGARASEFEGAILNVQLSRIDGMIRAMRRQKKRILAATIGTGLQPVRANSLDWECGSHVLYTFDDKSQAQAFAQLTGGTVTRDTGRHVYTEWDPILAQKGAPHEALNPYKLKENRECRKKVNMNMKSLGILERTVMLQTHPDHTAGEVKTLIKKISDAGKKVLG
jgi:dTDP-4-amino-4,6-dideoxygalactose transaminase